jgi:sugar phosphate isomerase/epimerase
MRRREFLAGSLASAGLLRAKTSIGASRISAISDEIAASPDAALAFARDFGLQWLELRNVPGDKSSTYFYMEPSDLKVAARKFADNGIRISFLNTSLLKFGLPGTELVRTKPETPEARQKRIAQQQVEYDQRIANLRKCIRSAQILGCDKMRIFTFLRVAEPEKLFSQIAGILEPMSRIAESEGIKLLVENESSCNVGTSAELAAFLPMLPAKTVGCNWDSLNGAALGEKPYPDGYRLLPKDRIWNVQIKGKSVLDPSERLDWAAIFHSLDHDGYTGELGLETHYFDGTNLEKSRLSMKEILRIAQTA